MFFVKKPNLLLFFNSLLSFKSRRDFRDLKNTTKTGVSRQHLNPNSVSPKIPSHETFAPKQAKQLILNGFQNGTVVAFKKNNDKQKFKIRANHFGFGIGKRVRDVVATGFLRHSRCLTYV